MECCGFIGVPSRTPLPTSGQAFVELNIDPGSHLAEMRILGQDMRTVFHSFPWGGPGTGFTFSFSNGMVFPDHIQFGLEPDPFGGPNGSYYIVSNSADALRIHGTAEAPCPGCADISTQLMHTNVVAILMSPTTLRVSEVEFCWNSVSNRNYQVQYRSALTTNTWTNLGSPVAGNGATNCIAHKVAPGQPQ